MQKKMHTSFAATDIGIRLAPGNTLELLAAFSKLGQIFKLVCGGVAVLGRPAGNEL